MVATPDGKHCTERALLRELLSSYRALNHNLFRGALRSPVLTLADSSGFWARWLPATRHIEVSRRLVDEQPWTVVLEVLKHEMAHQFVHEVLCEQETPHGPAFRNVCARLGIDARSAGLPEAGDHDPAAARVVERVQKLLALAQSDNPHEAQVAAAQAQRLMLKHNIGAAERAEPPSHAFRQIGRITGRTQEWERRLGNLLSEHFFVEVIWVPAFRREDGKRGHVMEAIGSRENLELADYVHDFVVRSAETLWLAHKRAEGIRGNGERRAFLSGVVAGFAEKLREQRTRHESEGLVWVPDAARQAYVRKRHPYLRSVSHRTALPPEAFGAGRRRGRDLVLQRGVKSGSGGEIRRLRG